MVFPDIPESFAYERRLNERVTLVRAVNTARRVFLMVRETCTSVLIETAACVW